MGAGLPAGLLVAAFSVLPYERINGPWPLKVSAEEVAAYAQWLDFRGSVDSTASAEVISLSDPGMAAGETTADAGWQRRLFSAAGFSDSVDARPLRNVGGGWELRFGKKALYDGQRRILLAPTTAGSIRAKYEELLAAELGLLAPEIAFVRLVMDGDTGIFIQEQRIDEGFLERRRITDGVPFTQGFDAQRPDHLLPEVDGDATAATTVRGREWGVVRGDVPAEAGVDPDAAAAYLLMSQLADRPDLLLDEGWFMYRWTTGRIAPLYHTLHDADEALPWRELSGHFIARLARDAQFVERMRAKREKLMEESWRLKERFAAIDKAWLPMLAGDERMGRAQAEADRIKQQLLERLAIAPDPTAWTSALDPVLPSPFADAAPSTRSRSETKESIAARIGAEVIGDSIVFRHRGKYPIREDLVLPPGVGLVLEKSVRLEIAPGRNVLVQGAFIARGTGANPVFIRPMREDSAFGTFAVSGDGNVRCELRGVLMSGGSGADIQGFRHRGMLSIHGAASIVLDRCVLNGSTGKSALEVKGGGLRIEGCRFASKGTDLVDLEGVQGAISDCAFAAEGEGSDGLGISGGRLLIENCTFSGFTERAVDAADVSEILLSGSRFNGNKVALGVKDLSIAHVDGCVFVENALVFSVQAKKAIHGGARLIVYANEFTGNARDREVDGLSTVVAKALLDAEVRSSFGLKP